MALREGGVSIVADGNQTTDRVLKLPYLGGDARVPVLLYSQQAAGTALTASSAETALSSYTLPANMLKPGAILRVNFQGIATATNSSDTLIHKLKIGSTALMTSATTDASDSDVFTGSFILVCRTDGESGTFVGSGSMNNVIAATGVAVPVYFIKASTAIDTTATQAITLTGKWSSTSASNSCRSDIFTVELL